MKNTAASSSGFQSKSENVSTMGLSEFELEKTIIGKISKKYSHHIQFEKKPTRPENVNKIWYKKDNGFTPLDREDSERGLKRIHSFKSNSPHKVFTPKESLDKFYPINKSVKTIKKRVDINVRKM